MSLDVENPNIKLIEDAFVANNIFTQEQRQELDNLAEVKWVSRLEELKLPIILEGEIEMAMEGPY